MKIKKHIWKFGIGALAVTVPTVALTSCGGAQSNSKYFAEMVVSDDSSVLLDKSFSETTYNGFRNFVTADSIVNEFGDPDNYQNVEKLDGNKDVPSVDSGSSELQMGAGFWRRPTNNRELTFRQIFNGGANLIIAPGFNHQDGIQNVAPQYTGSKGFLFLDGTPDTSGGKSYSNVASFQFRAEQSGFLAGIATAQFLIKNKAVFTKDDGKLSVGGFVGNAFPSTLDYLTGFQEGIIAYNIKATSNTAEGADKTIIHWVDLGKKIDDYTSGGFGPGQGRSISETLISKGADAIIPIAGPQTMDTISAIKSGVNGKTRPVIVVGVDSAQENVPDTATLLEMNKMSGYEDMKLYDANNNDITAQAKVVQFSAMKKLDEAVYQTLAAIFNTKDPNNANKKADETGKEPVKGFGFNNVGVLENNTVGISDNGLQWLKLYNESFVTNQGSSLALVNEEVLNDSVFKKMYETRVVYQNIDTLTNIDSLTTSGAVTASAFKDDGNSTISKLPTKNYDTLITDGSTPLNGSNWSFQKGQTKQQTQVASDLRRKD